MFSGIKGILLAAVMLLAGCLSYTNEEAHLTSDKVVKAIQADAIAIQSTALAEPLAFNKLQPSTYSLGELTDSTFKTDQLYIYEYHSAADRQRGMEEFNEFRQLAKLLLSPTAYEQHNLLIIYWHDSNQPSDYTERLRQIISSL